MTFPSPSSLPFHNNYALLRLICYAFVQPCSFVCSLSTRLAGRVINHFCTRYAIFLYSFEYCHLLELYVQCAASIGHSFHSSSGIRDAREKIPSDPVAGLVRGRIVGQGSYKQKTLSVIRGMAYMSTQREVFEGQMTPVERSEAGFGRGVRGASPRNFQKPVLQMVQSELFLSYICQCN